VAAVQSVIAFVPWHPLAYSSMPTHIHCEKWQFKGTIEQVGTAFHGQADFTVQSFAPRAQPL
jgi:hypothetical protein